MIMDEGLEFCDATALQTSGTTTNLIGDVIDLGAAGDVGAGQPLYLILQVAQAFTSGSSATVQFILASDAVAALAADGTESRHYTSDAYAVADLVLGWSQCIPLPSGDGNAANTLGYERYLGIETVVAVAALTAGKIDAFLTLDPHGYRSYPDAVK